MTHLVNKHDRKENWLELPYCLAVNKDIKGEKLLA